MWWLGRLPPGTGELTSPGEEWKGLSPSEAPTASHQGASDVPAPFRRKAWALHTKSRGGHWPSRGAFSPLCRGQGHISFEPQEQEKTNLTFLLDQKCVWKGFSFTSCVQGICWPSSLENFLPPLHETLLTPRSPDLRRRQVLRADRRLS